MAVNFFFIKIETRKCNNESQSVVIRLKIRINGEKRVLVFAFLCGIFTVDPTFSHPFQMPNNIFENVKLIFESNSAQPISELSSALKNRTEVQYLELAHFYHGVSYEFSSK